MPPLPVALRRALSWRARAWLHRVGWQRDEAQLAAPDELEALCEAHPALLDVLLRFELTLGGLVVEPEGRVLELGIARLRDEGHEPEVIADPPRVRAGVETYVDLWLDAAGGLWLSGPDGEVGEIAGSAEKYLEQLAASVWSRWPKGLGVACTPAPALVEALGLTRDARASDHVVLRADGERCALELHLRGTAHNRGQAQLVCRDFAALWQALDACTAAIPGFTAVLTSGLPGERTRRVEDRHAPAVSALEIELGAGAVRRIPALHGGAIFLHAEPRRLDAYALQEDGALRDVLALDATGARRTEYFSPWPDAEEGA